MDVVTGLIFLGVSGAILFVAKGYPSGTVEEGMGARFVPLLLGSLLAFLSLLLLLKGLFWGESRWEAHVGSAAAWPFDRHLLVPVILIILLSLYLFLLDWLGFLIATPLFLLTAMMALGSGVRRAAAVGIAFTVGAYVVFDTLLGVPLPAIPFLGS